METNRTMPQTDMIGVPCQTPAASRTTMPSQDRQAASELLDEAMETLDPNVGLRCRVVAALLHGHEPSKIVRNLGVTEKMIQVCKAKYDDKGLAGLR
ncbi:hypothetical protein D3C71_360690 [compost metagenome]